MKRCSKCNKLKHEDEFRKHKRCKDGLCTQCRECVAAVQRKRKYGISTAQKWDMLKDQMGGCKICGKDLTFHEAHVDHDHTTSRVRGLLCRHCNMGLGLFHDDPIFLRQAAKYIEDIREDDVTGSCEITYWGKTQSDDIGQPHGKCNKSYETAESNAQALFWRKQNDKKPKCG